MVQWLRGIILAFFLNVPGIATAQTPAVPASGFEYYEIGNPATPTPGKRSTGLMLMGGGEWQLDAFRWFLKKAGNGHIVVLRASGGAENQEEIFNKIGGVQSVRTIVFYDRKAASDPKVLATIRSADGIYLGGGDQSKYIRFWKGTEVEKLINAHVASGRPLGGTSAGLAVLGHYSYGAMDGGSIESVTALADPMGSGVTLVDNFLKLPFLSRVITDSHFHERNRLGRLISFVANIRSTSAGFKANVVGLGIDEYTVICIDENGIGQLYSGDGGYGWLVRPVVLAPKAIAGHPLDYPHVVVIGIGPNSRINFKTLDVENPAFVESVDVKAGKLVEVIPPPGHTWSLAIHGGAGVIERGSLSPEKDAAYRKGLSEALATGSDVLRSGGSSLDAVEAAVRVLEDNPLFNAGRGAVFTADGVNELDASIMDGQSMAAGAVAGVTRTRNPISLARAVMEKSPHVMLARDGADRFSKEHGLEQVDPSYFRTEERWKQIQAWQKKNLSAAFDRTHLYGTVGAVALDIRGHVAAATSTGGMTGKRWGRIGDSPIIGAGTYAKDGVCAVSATGSGEYFIRESAARQLCDRIDWKGQSVQEAGDATIKAIGEIGGDGGMIAIDGKGNIGFSMNSPGMYRGSISATQPAVTAIYADEAGR